MRRFGRLIRQVCRAGVGLALGAAVGAGALNAPASPAVAQDDGACHALYQAALVDMMAHCFSIQSGTACSVSGDVTIAMASGQEVNGPGGAARLSGVGALHALPGDGSAWSMASLTIPDPLDARKVATLLVLGPLDLTFEADPALPAGAVFTIKGGADPFPCSDLPRPGVLVQSPPNMLTLLRANGIDVAVNGLALIHPLNGGIEVASLAKETILGQTGTVVFAGYGVQASGDSVSPVVPYDPASVAYLPVEILPEMTAIALPGNATVKATLTLFSRPAAESYTNTMVKAGLPVSVFGRSADDQWLYIRTYDGQLGWFPNASLDVSVPGELPVLTDAPPSPIRPFGSMQGLIKTSAEYNNLREGPGESYAIVATVPLWTDLTLYGRSTDDQWLYVETQDGQRAWISVLLVSPSTPYTLNELPYPPGYGG
jgi:SH3-like domain-containing protein